MKSFLFVIACALALTACSSSTTPTPTPIPDPQPTLPVSGTIAGVPAGVDLTTPGTTLQAQNGSGDVLGTATVNADGTFNVTLQEPTADQLDIAPKASLLSPAVLVTGFDCDSVDFSSASAQGTALLELEVINEAGDLLGYIRQASSVEVATTWYTGTGTLPVGTGYINLYVTEALTIKATNCFRQSSLNINFEVVLGRGWNTLKINKAADGAITVTRKPDAEIVGTWFFAGQ
jgi:hypothetical protein